MTLEWMNRRRKCIPILRPHNWHWADYSEIDQILTVRCSRCLKYKVMRWE